MLITTEYNKMTDLNPILGQVKKSDLVCFVPPKLHKHNVKKSQKIVFYSMDLVNRLAFLEHFRISSFCVISFQ